MDFAGARAWRRNDKDVLVVKDEVDVNLIEKKRCLNSSGNMDSNIAFE